MQFYIRTFDDPVLKIPCVGIQPDEDVTELVAAMRKIMTALSGVGLAAPQVGASKRVILVRNQVMINPTVIKRSPTKYWDTEGCLSFPGIQKKIERHLGITVQFENEKREIVQQALCYLEARIAQHELDHLDGVCRVGEAYDPAVHLNAKQVGALLAAASIV